ncbi:unnamed protein product [Auanema sp. JU1783]|nr:unnamed protein product [Auanema sp. JU1783]
MEDEDTISEELEVIATRENQDYVNKLAVGKLTRLARHRSLWNNEFNAYFVVLVFLISFDVLNNFSVNLKMYGVVFLPVYSLAMVFVAFPLLYLELALGQYTSSTCYHIFDRMAPGFAGIGIASMIFNFVKILSDNETLRIFLSLFMNAINPFSQNKPWEVCVNEYNNDKCFQSREMCPLFPRYILEFDEAREMKRHFGHIGDVCYQTDVHKLHEYLTHREDMSFTSWIQDSAIGQFFFWNTDYETLTINTYPSPTFILYTFTCLALLYLISHASNRVIVTAAKTGILLLVSVITTLISFFLAHQSYLAEVFEYFPEFRKMFSLKLWVSAILLSLSALKVGQGGLSYLGAQNKDSFVYLVIVIFIPMFYAVVHLLLIENSHVAFSKVDLYPGETQKSAVDQSNHPVIQILHLVNGLNIIDSKSGVAIFSFMAIVVLLCNTLIRLEILVSSMLEAFPFFSYDGRKSRSALVCILLCLVFMYSFIFHSPSGMKLYVALDQIVYPDITLGIVIFHLVIVCVCYGSRRLFVNISCMIHSAKISSQSTMIFNGLVAILWVIVIPAALFVTAAYRVTEQLSDNSIGVLDLPSMLRFGILSIIPLMFIDRVMKRIVDGTDIFALFKPDRELWGARSKKDRDRVQRKEKELLV